MTEQAFQSLFSEMLGNVGNLYSCWSLAQCASVRDDQTSRQAIRDVSALHK